MADTDVADRARKRMNTYLVMLVVPLVLIGPLAAVTVFLANGNNFSDLGGVGWLILGLVSLSSVIVVGALIRGSRRGVRWLQPALIAGVDGARRKEIRAAIRADRPVDEADQFIAVDLAQRMAKQGWIAISNPVLAAFLILTRLFSDDFNALDLLVIATAVFLLAGVPFILRDVRRARQWLADHADQ